MTSLIKSVILALFLRASATAVSVGSRAAPTDLCNVATAEPNLAGTKFPPPAFPTSFIGLGVGTQNWTCIADELIWANVGTNTEIFDISCLFGTASFNTLPEAAFAAWNASTVTNVADSGSVLSAAGVLTNPFILGQSFQVQDPLLSKETVPFIDFSQSLKSANAIVFGDVIIDELDPNTSLNPDVNYNWFEYQNETATATLARTVYVLNTQGGQAPEACTTVGSSLILKYVSTYWLFGSSL
ncbi:hypothetical protein BT96DRAFT_971307 [Gymnopus androsaceus JB14]|uniref:Malate dehydrogenase n=1 Tax=Gymnopus androsaceus JB14 TaxID=1447944 RepID=A0A6A4IER9_9AGAR|nr:hypothetical protein BT96DRAFT_971307 [Gymnopus androsaceus JB14]